MSLSRKNAARPCEEQRHTLKKFRRVVSMKITIESRKACNNRVEFKKLQMVIKMRGVDETKVL